MMTLKLREILILATTFLLCFCAPAVRAQNGGLDSGFVPPVLANTSGESSVLAVVESGGKILVAGNFDRVDGQPVGRLLRLMPNGTPDPTFITGTGANAAIRCMLVLSSQKILIGGDFTEYNGTPRGRIARLNSDGSLDTGFDPGSGFDGPVHCFQSQSQIPSNSIVGGSFSQYNGVPRSNIALLNSSGVLSTSFSVGTNGPVYAILSASFLPQGSSVLIGGNFTLAGGSARSSLAGFSSSGTVTGFNSGIGLGPNGIVHSIVQLTGASQVWVGGSFSSYSGWTRQNLALLDYSTSSFGGVTDNLSFAPVVSVDGPIYAMFPRDSFSMLVGGGF